MYRATLLAIYVTIVALARADIFTMSIGDPNKDSASLTEPPTLTNSKVFVTDTPSNDGVTVILSEEVRSNVQQAVDNCKQVDDQCFQSVKGALVNPNTELDARNVGVPALLATGLIAFVSYIMDRVNSDMRGTPIPIGGHFTGDRFGKASSAAMASTLVMVTGSGSPVATVTQRLSNTVATGSQTPAITTFLGTASGHSTNDVIITISSDLVSKITELIHRSERCEAGNTFNNNQKIRKRFDDYGGVICGAQSVLMNAVPGAAFGDLAMLRADPLPWKDKAAVQAESLVMDFAGDLAPALGVDVEEAMAIGVAAFGLSWILVIQHRPLGTENRLPGSALGGSLMPSTATSTNSTNVPSGSSTNVAATVTFNSVSSSPSSSSGGCLATCFMTGPIKKCQTHCPTQPPGEAAPKSTMIRTVSVEPWIPAPLSVQMPMQAPVGACNPDGGSVALPRKVFAETYEKFCKEADVAWGELTWVTDGKGHRVDNKVARAARRNFVHARNDLSAFNITLWWRPAYESKLMCSASCTEAFDQLLSSELCKAKDIDDQAKNMMVSGGMDIGCGSYSYSIYAPVGENHGVEANCDSHNKIKVESERFEDSISSACHDHNELKRLKKREIVGWDWNNVDSEHFQWSFDWKDQSEQCDMKCEDIFSIFQEDDKCVWDHGMSKSGFVTTKCGTASYSVDNPNSATCWNYEFGAPRGKIETDQEGGAQMSVEDALEEFCNDIDGQKVLADGEDSKNSHAKRFGYSEWGIKDRRSFWLRAQYAPRDGCQGYEWPHKTNCKAALKQGMEQCTPKQGRTNGLIIPGIGCIDYSIHLTDDVHDENPPWKDPVPMWPAAYSAPTKDGGHNTPKCIDDKPTRSLADDDLNKAIDAFCTDGEEIKGYGESWKNMFNYPPEGQTQFYPNDRHWYHLTMGAATVNQGDPQPYQNMDWCKGYDFKLKKDDCTFALRKLHHDCRDGQGGLYGGDFTYRCVHYKSWGVNMGNCDTTSC